MYVLQNEDGLFYWKNENTSSSHGLKEGFENAYLFNTKKVLNKERNCLAIQNVLLEKLNLI